MYWLDTTILIALCIGAGLGFWSGLLWQVARVLSLALSAYTTVVVNEPVADFLGEHVLKGVDTRLTRGVAYVLVFVAVYLVLFLLTRLIHKTIRAARLEMLDRLLGAVLGAAKMALVIAALCALLAAVSLPLTQEWLEQSTLAPLFARGTDALFALVPEHYRTQVNENLHQMRDALQRQAAEQALGATKRHEQE